MSNPFRPNKYKIFVSEDVPVPRRTQSRYNALEIQQVSHNFFNVIQIIVYIRSH